jgi:hypothetical protein
MIKKMDKEKFKKELKKAIKKGLGTEDLWDGENETIELTFDEDIALEEVLKVLKNFNLIKND